MCAVGPCARMCAAEPCADSVETGLCGHSSLRAPATVASPRLLGEGAGAPRQAGGGKVVLGAEYRPLVLCTASSATRGGHSRRLPHSSRLCQQCKVYARCVCGTDASEAVRGPVLCCAVLCCAEAPERRVRESYAARQYCCVYWAYHVQGRASPSPTNFHPALCIECKTLTHYTCHGRLPTVMMPRLPGLRLMGKLSFGC